MIGTILMIGIAVGLSLLFYVQVTALMSDRAARFSPPKSPPTLLFVTYAYDSNTGTSEVCVYVSGDGCYSDGRIYLYDSDGGLVDTAPLDDNVLDLAARGVVRSCGYLSNNHPPGNYRVKLAFEGAGTADMRLHVPVQCVSDANCPDVVRIDGNQLYSEDMACISGYCKVVDSNTYVCTEANAQVCGTLSVMGATYYCEIHGPETLWLTAPREFLDDLNDNDCDGTVMVGCDSCKSCTHDLNDIAPSLASAGKNVVVVLTADLMPSDSDLTFVHGYWCISYSCIAVAGATVPGAGHISFDGNNHQITLTGQYAIDSYAVGGSGYLDFNNLRVVGGGICFDNTNVYSHATNISVTDGVPAFLYNYCRLRDVNYSCAAAYFNTVACITFSANSDLNTVHVTYPQGYGLLTYGRQYSLDNVVLSRNGSGYDFYLSPRYPYIGRVYCSNGKEYRYVSTYGTDQNLSSEYCGYMFIGGQPEDNFSVYFNGQTISGGGIAINGVGNVVIFGPGAVTDSAVGIMIGQDINSVVFDLSGGDINLCGNYDSLSYLFTRPTCRNCNQGHYIYADSRDFSYFNCDSNCLRAC